MIRNTFVSVTIGLVLLGLTNVSASSDHDRQIAAVKQNYQAIIVTLGPAEEIQGLAVKQQLKMTHNLANEAQIAAIVQNYQAIRVDTKAMKTPCLKEVR